jgi:hypothetical protein
MAKSLPRPAEREDTMPPIYRPTIPARRGIAARIPMGPTVGVINTHGSRVVDTWAFVVLDLGGARQRPRFVRFLGSHSRFPGCQGIRGRMRADPVTLVQDREPLIRGFARQNDGCRNTCEMRKAAREDSGRTGNQQRASRNRRSSLIRANSKHPLASWQ